MALGCFFGAGGVKSLYRCYVGAGGVRTVSSIYAGINGSVKKIWPSGLIYDAGTVYEPLTYHTPSGTSGSASLTYGSSAITVTNTTTSGTGSYHNLWLYTEDLFDMSDYSTLTFNYNVTETTTNTNAPTITVGVSDNTTESGYYGNMWDAYITTESLRSTGSGTVSVDISGVTKSEYVKIMFHMYSNTTFTVDVTHIELT